MAFFEDVAAAATEGGAWPWLGAGVGLLLLGPVIRPALKGGIKLAIKGGILAYDWIAETAAEASQGANKLVDEAREEIKAPPKTARPPPSPSSKPEHAAA